MLSRIREVIPLGAQTFSKSYLQWPLPLLLDRGMGARVWDTQGREYIDYVGGLLPVVLGYCDPDVDAAIKVQLEKGISFSFPTKLELELAELLRSIIPCADMVRFGKNGSDVTTAAVRLARYHTRRDKILLTYNNYHGWHDWSIGCKGAQGVPEPVKNLSQAIPYGDLEYLERFLVTEQYAAFIIEPNGDKDYLQRAKILCEHHRTLLIFDEIITGFRVHLGGAQSYYGVKPHLACFGKAMANGMPISALVGREDIMQSMERIFYSGTFAGECLSIAAAIACIKKIKSEFVIERLKAVGRKLKALPGVTGEDWRPKIEVENQSLWRQEAVKAGLLAGTHFNLMLAHEGEFEETERRYMTAREAMKTASLKGPPIRAALR